MKSFLLIICPLALLISCTVKNANSEFIQFNHMNAVIIGGDKLTITLIPTRKKRKRPVIVKIFRKGEYFDNKRISHEQYQQIRELITELNQKDIELTQSPNKMVAIIDGGSNSIILKDYALEKKLYAHGISKEYHGKFYEVTKLILKVANLEMKDVN